MRSYTPGMQILLITTARVLTNGDKVDRFAFIYNTATSHKNDVTSEWHRQVLPMLMSAIETHWFLAVM